MSTTFWSLNLFVVHQMLPKWRTVFVHKFRVFNWSVCSSLSDFFFSVHFLLCFCRRLSCFTTDEIILKKPATNCWSVLQRSATSFTKQIANYFFHSFVIVSKGENSLFIWQPIMINRPQPKGAYKFRRHFLKLSSSSACPVRVRVSNLWKKWSAAPKKVRQMKSALLV